MKKLTLIALLIYSTCVFAVDRELTATFENSISTLQKALNEHDFALLKPLLDEDFTYGEANCGGYCNGSLMAMEIITKQYKYEITKIEITEIKFDVMEYKVQTVFHFTEGESKNQEIVLSQEGKFLRLSVPHMKIIFGTPPEKQEGCSTECNENNKA